jgi:hypothetical protein
MLGNSGARVPGCLTVLCKRRHSLNMAEPNRPKVQRWPTAHSQSTRVKCTWENNRWLPFPILQFPTETKRINNVATVGCCIPSAQGKYCAMRGWCKGRGWSESRAATRPSRVPGVCGECFETSPVPSALCQSVGCQYTNRVFNISPNSFSLCLSTLVLLSSTIINRHRYSDRLRPGPRWHTERQHFTQAPDMIGETCRHRRRARLPHLG